MCTFYKRKKKKLSSPDVRGEYTRVKFAYPVPQDIHNLVKDSKSKLTELNLPFSMI